MVGSPATAAGAQMLRRARIPVVETWDLPDDPIDAVAGFDNTATGAAVARHFAAAERRRLAVRRGRRSACHQAMDLLLPGRPGRRTGTTQTPYTCTQRRLRRRRRSRIERSGRGVRRQRRAGIGVLAGLRQLKRRVPEDVGLIGLGDLEIGRLVHPSLSTVRIDGEAIGRTAGTLTVSRQGPRRIDLGFSLVTRETG
jgi:LacI family gluconate utilization system Gnt-I transcriptional repressor